VKASISEASCEEVPHEKGARVWDRPVASGNLTSEIVFSSIEMTVDERLRNGIHEYKIMERVCFPLSLHVTVAL
jgi:hypothetical protein